MDTLSASDFFLRLSRELYFHERNLLKLENIFCSFFKDHDDKDIFEDAQILDHSIQIASVLSEMCREFSNIFPSDFKISAKPVLNVRLSLTRNNLLGKISEEENEQHKPTGCLEIF